MAEGDPDVTWMNHDDIPHNASPVPDTYAKLTHRFTDAGEHSYLRLW